MMVIDDFDGWSRSEFIEPRVDVGEDLLLKFDIATDWDPTEVLRVTRADRSRPNESAIMPFNHIADRRQLGLGNVLKLFFHHDIN